MIDRKGKKERGRRSYKERRRKRERDIEMK